MTLWFLLVVVVAAGVFARNARARVRRFSTVSHQRVLSTLDEMTRSPVDQPLRDRVDESRQHVRLVAASDVRRGRRVRPVPVGTAPTPVGTAPVAPVVPGRRGGVVGAKPFRAPVPQPEEVAVPAAVARIAPVGGAPAGAAGVGAAGVGVADVAGSGGGHDAQPRVRFDDAAGGAVGSGPALSDAATPVPSFAPVPAVPRRTRRRGAGRRPPRLPDRTSGRAAGAIAGHPTVAVLAGVVVVAGLAVAIVPGGSRSPAAGRHADVTAPPSRPAPAAAAPPSTATTAPPPPVELASSSPAGSVYTLSGPVTITLTATAPSWAEVRSGGPTGAVAYRGVLAAGQTETVPGPAWIRLGNPLGVTVVVNGTPVRAPSLVSGQPTNLQFG